MTGLLHTAPTHYSHAPAHPPLVSLRPSHPTVGIKKTTSSKKYVLRKLRQKKNKKHNTAARRKNDKASQKNIIINTSTSNEGEQGVVRCDKDGQRGGGAKVRCPCAPSMRYPLRTTLVRTVRYKLLGVAHLQSVSLLARRRIAACCCPSRAASALMRVGEATPPVVAVK